MMNNKKNKWKLRNRNLKKKICAQDNKFKLAEKKKMKKQQFHKAKINLIEQVREQKIKQKDIIKIKNHNVKNSNLLKFSVLTEGVKNTFSETKTTLYNLKQAYKEQKTVNNKKAYEDIKKVVKIEAKKQKKEISQINKLNKNPKGKLKIKNEPGISIKVENVRKYYASKHIIYKALDNVNLSFKKGSFNVILGPSGSGKTTLLNVISGLDRSSAGKVIINDTNIQALSSKQVTQFRRHNIGFVFQSYNLLESLNVNDNIEVGRSLQVQKRRRQNIKELLKEMGMQKNRKKMTYELSGGQQQRVSIARAISKTPQILIGDEPTGAIDRKTSADVFEVFKKINKKYKTTVIIVTHNPNVAKLADQVIHVQDGEIAKVEFNPKPKPASFIATA